MVLVMGINEEALSKCMPMYNKCVKAVGELIMKGVWYSDACEIVPVVMGLQRCVGSDGWWDRFEMDVNNYTDREIHLNKRACPIPKYKCIF